MPSSNRLQVTSVKELTLGTTPGSGSPRMKKGRLTAEGLFYRPAYVDPMELRDDRMTSDPINTGTESGGTINFDLSLPFPNSPLSTNFESAFYNTWTEVNSRDNDGTADSVITDVATTNTVLTVTTGTGFVVRELYRWTGFSVALNNGIFMCTTASATVPRFVGSGITDEAAPPAAARVKCVGILGASGDITATASGLACTTLSFTDFPGLAVGRWIKVGGTATADKFATAVLNTWIRITAVAANALTCDNLPAGWTTDAGTSKTIKIWYGDELKNGVTQIGQTIEKGFMGQTVPTYIAHTGMVAAQFSHTFEAKQRITGTVTYMGMSGSQGTTSLDASPDAPTLLASFPVIAASANVGRVGEAGAALASPNFVRSLNFQINNNVTPIDAVDSLGPQGLTGHECTVTGTMSTYFGDNSLLTKFFAGTATSINLRATKGNQAIIYTLPRVTYNGDGSPQASGKNVDLMLNLSFVAAKDEALTNAMILVHRFEYWE